MQTEELERVSQHWGNAEDWAIGKGDHWTEHPAVQERINEKTSGDRRRDPYRFLIDFLANRNVALPIDRCLTLGCGVGCLERGLDQYGFSRRYDAYDIADNSIRRATAAAESAGLQNASYEVADVNTVCLDPDAYDVVFGVMSIHHLSNLEHVFHEVRKSLKDGGLFFLNEFVGPTKFQWTDRQLSAVNGLLNVLPEKYRRTKHGNLKTRVDRPTIEEMNAVDPSEAIRSGEILAALSPYFSITERRDYGGTLLHLLLEGIVFNFHVERPEDMRILKMIFDVEDVLLQVGDLASDFTVIVAEPL